MNTFLVWDSTFSYELVAAKNLGIDLFANCEVISSFTLPTFIKNDPRKKIAFVHYEFDFLSEKYKNIDFSWFDLIICFGTETSELSVENSYLLAVDNFKNYNIIFIRAGLSNKNLPFTSDRVFFPYNGFLLKVLQANQLPDINFENSRSYLFDALLGTAKHNRIFIFQQLQKYNLLEKSIVNLHEAFYFDKVSKQQVLNGAFNEDLETLSWVNRYNPAFHKLLNYESPWLRTLENLEIQNFKDNAKNPEEKYSGNLLENVFYGKSQYRIPMSIVIPTMVFANSWYSLIAETNCFDQILFLTEKTAKPLYSKRIFVSFSYQGHLAFIKQQGFKTFDDIIDESYDNEEDIEVRFSKAWDQVLILAKSNPKKIYQKAEHILKHNQDIYKDVVVKNLQHLQSFIQTNLQKL